MWDNECNKSGWWLCHSSPQLKGVFKLMGSWIGIAHSHDQSRGKKEARIYETADQLHGYRPLRLILEIAVVQIPHLDYWGKSILTIFSWELVSPPTSSSAPNSPSTPVAFFNFGVLLSLLEQWGLSLDSWAMQFLPCLQVLWREPSPS